MINFISFSTGYEPGVLKYINFELLLYDTIFYHINLLLNHILKRLMYTNNNFEVQIY